MPPEQKSADRQRRDGQPASLAEVRAGIDDVDQRLVAVLADRERLVRAAAAFKSDTAAVRAPARVEQVVAAARARAVALGADADVVERTYRAMVAAYVDLELTAHAQVRPVVAPVVGPPGVRLRPATAADSGEILTLQRAAYATEAALYDDPRLPALVQTHAELDEELRTSTALVAVLAGRVVGAVRARAEPPRLHIGRLVVAPDLQGRGVGTALLVGIEASAPDSAMVAALFTGERSEGNLSLYRRHGYATVRTEELRPGLRIVHLEKALHQGDRRVVRHGRSEA